MEEKRRFPFYTKIPQERKRGRGERTSFIHLLYKKNKIIKESFIMSQRLEEAVEGGKSVFKKAAKNRRTSSNHPPYKPSSQRDSIN